MIEIVYDRKGHRVAMRGHAKSGEKGHDLVCAAASMLCYTLAANVAQLAQVRRYVRRPIIKMEDGDATVAVKAIHGMDGPVTLVFDSVCLGFDVLARDYPNNVKYSVLG